MKLKLLLLLVLCFAAGSVSCAASSTPTVEFRGSFIKITAGYASDGTPVDPDVPALLYIRKSSIAKISVMISPRSSDFVVELVTSDPFFGPNSERRGLTVMDGSRTYLYHFINQPGAVAFCEALLSDQKE